LEIGGFEKNEDSHSNMPDGKYAVRVYADNISPAKTNMFNPIDMKWTGPKTNKTYTMIYERN